MAILKDLVVQSSARVIGSVYGASFIKAGGTSSQFLKADGSVDNNTYALASAIPTVPSFTSLGSTKVPIYLSSTNTFSACASFASGTSITLNGSNKAAQTATFYAPTDYGASGFLLRSKGANSSPEWIENILTIITVNDSGVNFTSNDGTKYINPLIGGTLTVQASNHWIKAGVFEGKESPILGIAHETLYKERITLGNNDKFSYGIPIRIPSITIDEAGHITKGDDTLITIPEPKDEKVKQSPSTTTSWKKILLSCNTVSTNTASITADLASIAYYSNALSVKPSTGEIKAGGFIKDANSTNILLADGSSIAQSTFSTTDNKVASLLSSSPSWAKILFTASTSSTSTGSITNATNSVYYINSFSVQPSTGEVDATSYRANGNNVYIGASATSQCHQQYDATNKCLKFIFD